MRWFLLAFLAFTVACGDKDEDTGAEDTAPADTDDTDDTGDAGE
jgi:hypothetical protein